MWNGALWSSGLIRHVAKGRRIESPSFSFFCSFRFQNQWRRGARYEKKRKCTKVARNEESWQAPERREKKKKDLQVLQERVELQVS